jgi:peptidoglycan/LPS O-acetylase OafA/YrhL
MSSLHQQRLLALDGLRAVSILLVLVSHAWLGHIVPGGLGVTIFFFISGFIITRLMISEWDKTGTISIKKFYIRRFFRLMPALIVFVVLSLITMQLAHVNWTWTELSSVFFILRIISASLSASVVKYCRRLYRLHGHWRSKNIST